MPRDAVIEFGALLVGQGYRVGLQAFPNFIEQLSLFDRGEASNLIAQSAHGLKVARFCQPIKRAR